MKILIADDHSLMRKGLLVLLREEFPSIEVFEATNSVEALALAKNHVMHIILLDISMPGRNGIETLKQMRCDGVTAPILMLSMHSEEQYALRALKAGGSGFVNKSSANDELLVAIHRVLDGRKYISSSLVDKLAGSVIENGSDPAHLNLSNREMEVLQHIASGKNVSQIAILISLSVNTISTYRTRILEKLSLRNSAEITRYALDNSLV